MNVTPHPDRPGATRPPSATGELRLCVVWCVALVYLVGLGAAIGELYEYGFAMFVVLPMTVGLFAGIFSEGNTATGAVMVLLAAAAAVALLLLLKLQGTACVVILLLSWLVPLVAGVISGRFIRWITGYGRRPGRRGSAGRALLALAGATLATGAVERFASDRDGDPVYEVVTQVAIDQPREVVWNSLLRSRDYREPSAALILATRLPDAGQAAPVADDTWRVRSADAEVELRITRQHSPSLLSFRFGAVHYAPHRGLFKQERFTNWITLLDGSFELEERDGLTLVTRRTRYQLHLRPALWFSTLARIAGGAVHRRVLEALRRGPRGDGWPAVARGVSVDVEFEAKSDPEILIESESESAAR